MSEVLTGVKLGPGNPPKARQEKRNEKSQKSKPHHDRNSLTKQPNSTTKKRRKKGTTKHDASSSESESEDNREKDRPLNTKTQKQIASVANVVPEKNIVPIPEGDATQPSGVTSETKGENAADKPGAPEETENYSSRYSRRKIVSNWDRYKSLSDEEHLQEALESDSYSSEEEEPVPKCIATNANLEELNAKVLSLLTDADSPKPSDTAIPPTMHLNSLDALLSLDESNRTEHAFTEPGARCPTLSSVGEDDFEVDSLLRLANSESKAPSSFRVIPAENLPSQPNVFRIANQAAVTTCVNVPVEADWLEDLLGEM